MSPRSRAALIRARNIADPIHANDNLLVQPSDRCGRPEANVSPYGFAIDVRDSVKAIRVLPVDLETRIYSLLFDEDIEAY